jgi:hypothetical protein
MVVAYFWSWQQRANIPLSIYFVDGWVDPNYMQKYRLGGNLKRGLFKDLKYFFQCYRAGIHHIIRAWHPPFDQSNRYFAKKDPN